MPRNVSSFFITILFFLSLCAITADGQPAGVSENKQTVASGDKPTRLYNVTTIIPVTFNGQFLNGAQTIFGYKILPDHLFIGGGIGYEYFKSIPTYDVYKANLSLLPVFIDIRYTVLKGRISPVVALNAGYKFLLNKAPTQTTYDTVYGSVMTVSTRNDYQEYNVYKQGGFFITPEIGLSARVSKLIKLYLSFDYSLWSVSGDYHLLDQLYLLGSDDVWRLKSSVETPDKSLAYCHIFYLRFGIAF